MMLAGARGDHPRSIINITSVSAAASSPEQLDYCISKAGLAAFTQGLALRLAERFRGEAGIIRTDMTIAVTSKYNARITDGLVPMKRLGEAADIGAICASLASGNFASRQARSSLPMAAVHRAPLTRTRSNDAL